jgi:CheY-like chemotaxis protein
VLQPAAAQTLALVLHELVTNAAKYGALSSSTGRVHLSWELTDGSLGLQWTESGGPATEAPTSPGFGTRIIVAGIEGQLGGQVTFNWRPEGLQCVLTIPRDDIGPVKRSGNGATKPDAHEAAAQLPIPGNRILVVEDEALVAMALCETLKELGYLVIGPFSRISEAIGALRTNDVDAAILDINLGGEMVYPLADVLAEARIPFVFVTGYGAEEIKHRYDRVPILQKPIETDALKTIFSIQPAARASNTEVERRTAVG